MKIKTNSNLTCGILFLIFSVVIFLLIPSQIMTNETSSVNAQTVPKIMSMVIFFSSITLIYSGSKEPKKEYIIGKSLMKSAKFRSELRTMGYMAMLFIYLAVMPLLGFLISSLILVTCVLLYFGSRKWYFYLISYANVGLAYYVFKVLLNVYLP